MKRSINRLTYWMRNVFIALFIMLGFFTLLGVSATISDPKSKGMNHNDFLIAGIGLSISALLGIIFHIVLKRTK